MKIVASSYKGKWFVLQDSDIEDDLFMDAHVDVDYYTGHGLREHVETCRYYGIPAYIGSNKKLLKQIASIEKELDDKIETAV